MVFIRKGRHETTWAVLRQFGYDNRLRLSRDFLFPKLVIPPGCSTELSPAGLRFLHTVFTKYDVVSLVEAGMFYAPGSSIGNGNIRNF